jgi:ribosome maturation factor RimP
VVEDLSTRQRGGTTELRVVVDLPEDRTDSADLDTVAELSRELSEHLDADASLLGEGPTLLEVTTPGVDRPLTEPRHFRRNRDRLLNLELADGTTVRARLQEVAGNAGEETLTLHPEPGRDSRGRPRKPPAGITDPFTAPIAEVASARVEIEFTGPSTGPSTDTTTESEL